MADRPRVFYVFKDEPHIAPDRGDRINELFFLRALAKNFTVHYNGVPFRDGDATAGDPGRPVTVPSDTYDLYVLRGNADLFVDLPHPKATMAYPYDERVFGCADALLSTTSRWVEFIEAWNDTDDHPFLTNWYPHRIVAPKKVIAIGQMPSEGFTRLPRDHPDVRRYRHLYTNAPFVVGFFGRLDNVEQVPRYFEAMADRSGPAGDVLTVIGSPYPWELTTAADTLHLGNIPYADMPFATAACDLIVSGEERDMEWMGARKVLEAIAADVPVLTMPWAAKVEQLGDGYPLYYETAADVARLGGRYRTDPGFRQSVHAHLAGLREKLTFGAMADALAAKLRPLIGTD